MNPHFTHIFFPHVPRSWFHQIRWDEWLSLQQLKWILITSPTHSEEHTMRELERTYFRPAATVLPLHRRREVRRGEWERTVGINRQRNQSEKSALQVVKTKVRLVQSAVLLWFFVDLPRPSIQFPMELPHSCNESPNDAIFFNASAVFWVCCSHCVSLTHERMQ